MCSPTSELPLSGAGGRVGDLARRALVARATDAVLLTEGAAGAEKVKKRKASRGSAAKSRKHIQNYTDWLAQEVAQLTEEGVALLGRLGCGAEKLGLGDDVGDELGGLLETKGYKADKAKLDALEDKEDKTPEDKKAIKKARKALSQSRTRARKRVKREKDQERAKELPGRVAELEKEVCLLEFALDVM